MYRDALAARRAHDLAFGALSWVETGPDTLTFRSGKVTVVVNMGATPLPLPEGDVILVSGPLDGRSLPQDTTAWLRA
jgi:alpha-glucosidase